METHIYNATEVGCLQHLASWCGILSCLGGMLVKRRRVVWLSQKSDSTGAISVSSEPIFATQE